MASLRDELEKKLQDSNATPMCLPLDFLKAITCDFSAERELGRGGYGVVYKGVLQSGKIIAVKKLFEIHLLDDKKFQNEVGYLMEIKHQNIVQFIGYCAESSWETMKQASGKFIWAEIPKRLLCFEYVCNKSLDKYISDKSWAFEWNMRYEIIKGMCCGLNFLHEECRIIHLDLKPENILMDATMIPKIADFGLSRIFGNQESRIVTVNRAGSRGYMAPEYIIQGLISTKADIFSLGVIIIEIITGCREYPYFQQDSPQSTATSLQQFTEQVLGSWRNKFISTPKYKPMEIYTQQVTQCITVALKCVDPDMEKRPTAKEIVQVLSAVDQIEASNTLLILDTIISKELIPHCINEDMSNIETDGIVRDVKKSQEVKEAVKESSEQQQASDKTSEIEDRDESSLCRQCKDKFLVLNTTALKDLAPQSVTEKKTHGTVMEEAHFLSPSPVLESSIGNQNYQEGAKASSEPRSACDTTTETEVLPRILYASSPPQPQAYRQAHHQALLQAQIRALQRWSGGSG